MTSNPSISLRDTELRAFQQEGSVTVKRRIEPQPRRQPFQVHGDRSGNWHNENPSYPRHGNMMSKTWRCPYGKVGDVLAVKEAFRIHVGLDARIEYCAGGVWEATNLADRMNLEMANTLSRREAEAAFTDVLLKPRKRPAQHLPAWAVRTHVKVAALSADPDDAGVWNWCVTLVDAERNGEV